MEIVLNKGKVAIIDDEDFGKVESFKWRWEHSNMQSGYAVTSITVNGKKRGIKMHNLILPPPDGLEVDHRDGNGLDNRKNNLRYATRAQQCMNRRAQSNKSSKYKGVRLFKPTGRWQARIKISGRTIHLGSYATETEAALAYNDAARDAQGEFARLNEVPS